MASWMLSELFTAGGSEVNVNVRGGGGVFQVILDGVIVFGKADPAENGRTPDLVRAKEIKAQVKNMIEDKTAATVGD